MKRKILFIFTLVLAVLLINASAPFKSNPNYPTDTATGIPVNLTLNVTYSDPEGDTGTVHFYNQSNSSAYQIEKTVQGGKVPKAPGTASKTLVGVIGNGTHLFAIDVSWVNDVWELRVYDDYNATIEYNQSIDGTRPTESGNVYAIAYNGSNFFTPYFDWNDVKYLRYYKSNGMNWSYVGQTTDLSESYGNVVGLTYGDNKFYTLNIMHNHTGVTSGYGIAINDSNIWVIGHNSSSNPKWFVCRYKKEYNLSLDVEECWDLDDLNQKPIGMAYANEKLYVTDIVDAKVYIYNESNQSLITSFSTTAEDDYPCGIDTNGSVLWTVGLVLSGSGNYNQTFFQYALDGTYQKTIYTNLEIGTSNENDVDYQMGVAGNETHFWTNYGDNYRLFDLNGDYAGSYTNSGQYSFDLEYDSSLNQIWYAYSAYAKNGSWSDIENVNNYKFLGESYNVIQVYDKDFNYIKGYYPPDRTWDYGSLYYHKGLLKYTRRYGDYIMTLNASDGSLIKNQTSNARCYYGLFFINTNEFWCSNNILEMNLYNSTELIGTDTNVANGTDATIPFNELKENTLYNWYVISEDSGNMTYSDVWTFTTIDYTPTWSNNKTNASATAPTINQDIQMNLSLYDSIELSNYIFAFNCTTDGWLNDTAVDISGQTSYDMIMNKTVNQTLHPDCGWRVYFNDSSNNINETPIFTFDVINTPPTIPSTLTPTSGLKNNSIHVVCSGSTDADGDTIVYDIQTNRTGSWIDIVADDADGIYDWDISSYTEQAGVDLQCRSDDTAGTSSYYNPAGTLSIDNTAPRWSTNLTNASSTTKVSYDVYFNITWTDNYQNYSVFGFDDGAGSFTNDTAESFTSGTALTITKTITATRGQTVQWKWYANDTLNHINETDTWSITVANTVPTHTTPLLNATSSNNYTTDDLTCYNQTTADADSDTVTNKYKWFNGSTLLTAYENLTSLSSTNTSKGQSWKCEITPEDGYDSGTPLNSTALTILNTAPTIKTQNSFTNYSAGHHFNVSAEATDNDGTADISIVNISATSGSCTNIANTTSSNDFTAIFNCTGTGLATAGIQIGFNDSSGSYVSTTLSYNNYPNNIPVVTTPEFNNTTPYTNKDISANTTYTDTDSDSGTVYFWWYVNYINVWNQTIASVATGTLLISNFSSTNYSKTDKINVSVYANDGYDDSTTKRGTEITVQNSAPTIKTQNTFTNYSTKHRFNVSAEATDNDGTADISIVNISTTSGSCTNIANTTSSNDFTAIFNCTGTSLATAGIQIGFNDSSGSYVSTTLSYNNYPNNAPTFNQSIPDFNISHSEDLNISVNCSDADSDTITYYDNSTLFNINSSTGKINDNPTQAQAGKYRINISCDDGTVNVSTQFWYNITNLAPTFDEALTTQSIYHSANLNYDINCSDIDSDTITYYDNSTLFSINSSTGIITDNPTQADVGNHNILISCDDGVINTTSTFTYEVKNHAPSVSSIDLKPDAPNSTVDLNCSDYSYSDIDSDAESGTTYKWFKNSIYDQSTGTSPYLGGGNTSVNDIWFCEVTPKDGLDFGSPVNSTSETIGSLAPSISIYNDTSTITSPTNVGSDVTFTLDWTDPDAPEQARIYVCSSSSITSAGCGDTTFCSTANAVTDPISCNYTTLESDSGDNIAYYLKVCDDSDLCSGASEGTFSTNHQPNATNVSLSPATLYYNSTIICNYTFYDQDSDTENASLVEYKWYNWTGTWSNFSSAINLTNISKNTTLKCEIRIGDNHNFMSDWINSSNKTVQNTPADIVASINPSPAQTTDNLNCSYTFDDIDSDTDSGNWTKWYIDGNLSNETTIYLSSGNTSLDDDIICQKIVSDGTVNSTVNSTTLTIGDITPPTFLNNGSINKASYYSDETATVTIECSDENTIGSVFYTVNQSDNSVTNETMSWVSGNQYSDALSLSNGNYKITKFYCRDGSTNQADQNASLSFSVSTRPVTPPDTGGGGGGGREPEPEIVYVEDGNFTIETSVGGTSYEFPIVKNSEVMKTVEITNLGDTTINMKIYCISENHTCDWVNFSQTEFSVLPNKLIKKVIVITISIPENIENGEVYSFSAVVEDEQQAKGSISLKMEAETIKGYAYLGVEKLKDVQYTILFSEWKAGAKDIKIRNWVIVIFATILAPFLVWMVSKIPVAKWATAIYMLPVSILYILYVLFYRIFKAEKFRNFKERFFNVLSGINIAYTPILTFILTLVIL